MEITRRFVLVSVLLQGIAAAQSTTTQWTSMFNGKSLHGWKEASFGGHGLVVIKNGMIVIGKGRMTGVTWAGEFPKSGYEIRFEAARFEGNDFFAGLTFPVNDTFCSWINGGWGGTVVGISNLDFDDASENDTSTVKEFVQGRWYKFRLSVKENRIQAWIDDVVIIDADIKGRRVGLRGNEMDPSTPLGFATYSTVAGLRNIEFRLIQ